MRIVWDYGTTLFGVDSLNYVKFDYAKTDVSITPVYNRFETIDRRIVSILKGYRANFTVTIHNVTATDYQLWTRLLQLINISEANEVPFYIIPRQSDMSEWDTARKYEVVLTSDISPEDIGQGAGQRMTMTFTATDLMPTLPSYLSAQETNYWFDESDNQYVDESGNKYTMIN